MKLKIKYENIMQEITLNEDDTNKMWTCLELKTDKELSQKEKEKLIQEKFDDDFNKPEYNIYHRETRHIGNPIESETKGEEESLYSNAKSKGAFNKYEQAPKEDYDENLNKCLATLNRYLKPSQVDMVVCIDIKGMSTNDYAAKIGDSPNNVSHKHVRIKNKLKKLGKNVLFGDDSGY